VGSYESATRRHRKPEQGTRPMTLSRISVGVRFVVWWTLLWSASVAEEEVQSVCSVCIAGVPHGAGATTPRLFHRPSGVGAGNLLYSMVHAAAYARTRGWVYGGPLGISEKDIDAVNFVFNAGDYFTLSTAELKYISTKKKIAKASELANVKGPPWDSNILAVQADDWNTFEKTCPTEPFARFRAIEQVPQLDTLFQPAFLTMLQKSNQAAVATIPLHFKTNGRTAPRVAIHIRRGGLVKGSFSARKHTPDSYYYSIIEIIRGRYPKAEIHGFPALGKKGQAPDQNTTDYEGYHKRNVTLHFETDTVTAWAHMVTAEVFVMAHSVYSSVPALLSPNCVVYDPFWFGKLARHLTIHTLKEKFNDCYKADPVPKAAKGPPRGKSAKFPVPIPFQEE
jgi:hypothetical protein